MKTFPNTKELKFYRLLHGEGFGLALWRLERRPVLVIKNGALVNEVTVHVSDSDKNQRLYNYLDGRVVVTK